MSEVLLCGLSDPMVKRVRSALSSLPSGAIGIEATSTDDGLAAALVGERPRVVALGPEMNGRDRFALTREIIELDPTVGVLIVDLPSEDVVVKALEAGARGVLAPTSSTAETRATFERVLAVVDRLRERAAAEPEGDGQRTITVISAKGGAGKTVVAVNLAAAIAVRERRQTAIVDLDLQFGDVATALLLTPDHTIVEAAEAIDSVGTSTTALKVFLTRHSPTDLYVLCAPESPAAGERITGSTLALIIKALAHEFRYQVIDTGAGLDEHTLVALDHSTDLVMVVDLDVPSVRGARKMLEVLDTIGQRQARRHIVLNRADSRVGLKASEVAEALNVPIDITLPSSRAVPLSYNEGKPLVLAKPRHPWSQGIRILAERLIGVPARQGRTR